MDGDTKAQPSPLTADPASELARLEHLRELKRREREEAELAAQREAEALESAYIEARAAVAERQRVSDARTVHVCLIEIGAACSEMLDPLRKFLERVDFWYRRTETGNAKLRTSLIIAKDGRPVGPGHLPQLLPALSADEKAQIPRLIQFLQSLIISRVTYSQGQAHLAIKNLTGVAVEILDESPSKPAAAVGRGTRKDEKR